MRAFGKRGNVQVGVDDLHLVVDADIAGLDFAGADGVDHDDFGKVGIQFGGEQLDVEDQLGDVFLDAGNGRELMLHALYANAGGGHARQGIEKHPAQGVAQRLTKTTLQGIDDEFAIAVVVADLHPFDFRLFDLIYHSAFPPLLSRRTLALQPRSLPRAGCAERSLR